MNKEHLYGLNLYDDISHLYGVNCEKINNKRILLFNSLNSNILPINILKNIIQNPVPVSKEEYSEWIGLKNNTLEENKYDVPLGTVQILGDIEKFVIKYHLIEHGRLSCENKDSNL